MSLRVTNEWCQSVGLNINSANTTIASSTRKRKLSNMKDIRQDGTLIECKSEVKYLGITLETSMEQKSSRLTRAGTRGNETLCQRTWSSRAGLFPLLSLPNHEMVRKYSFEKNFLKKPSNKKKWKGDPPPTF
ncbi:hypothetical protein Trydic_g21166 [Trypoxylus dichotomus]